MRADFSGRELRLPPGIDDAPRLSDPPPDAVEPELTVGGRSILPADLRQPVVVTHPNRLGVAENLDGLALLAQDGLGVYVRIDPLLIDQCRVPPPLISLVEWALPDPGPRQRAGWRIRLAADFLRRRLRQVPGLRFLTDRQAGGAVALILPTPATEVASQLDKAGAAVDAFGPWEGSLVVHCGWWHTRAQLAGVAGAIAALLDESTPEPIPSDRYDRVPNDLAWRQLDTIGAPESEETV